MVTTTPPGLDVFQAHWSAAARLPMWVVTARPKDYPDGYVARMHYTLPAPEPTDNTIRAATLKELRAALPAGLWPFARDPKDDPVIVETWMRSPPPPASKPPICPPSAMRSPTRWPTFAPAGWCASPTECHDRKPTFPTRA